MKIEDLDEKCSRCRGTGRETDKFGHHLGQCDYCNGKGGEPSRDGYELLRFVARNWKELKRLRAEYDT